MFFWGSTEAGRSSYSQFSWMAHRENTCTSFRTTAIMPAAQASLSDLRRADGSATFSHNGYSVLGAVNGPLEVQRRDELPEEAAVEVNVRPASGVGSKSSNPSVQLKRTPKKSNALLQAPRNGTSKPSSTTPSATSSSCATTPAPSSK